MELQPFKVLIGMSKEKLNEAMAPIRAKQVKSKADLEMCKIEAQLLDYQTEIQEMCVDKDIDLPKLIDKLDDIDLLERRLKKYKSVLKQLFPEKQAA